MLDTRPMAKFMKSLAAFPHRHYFDHNATTPVCDAVMEVLPDALLHWGNPSSIHWGGRGSKTLLRESRQAVAQSLNVSPLEIVFTSGGSESNACILQGLAEEFQHSSRREILSTRLEHPSVLKNLLDLEQQGFHIHWVPVHPDRGLDLEFYQNALSEKTAFVTCMMANNETGMIFPLEQMISMAHQVGALFHTDAVQAWGKIPLDFQKLPVDYASFSGHKFYSVKGSGFLFARRSRPFHSLILGGGQERHRRGGTENTMGIAALGVVASMASEISLQSDRLGKLRDLFESEVEKLIPDVHWTSRSLSRLKNTSHLLIPGVDGETLLMSLDMKGYAVSTGAACSSGNPEPSPVLLALGMSRSQAQQSLRVSLGWGNTEQEVLQFAEVLQQVVLHLRQISQYVSTDSRRFHELQP